MNHNLNTEAVEPRLQPLPHLKRVALVAGNFVNVADGAAMTLHRIVDALEARQVQVLVVAPADSDPALAVPRRLSPPPSLAMPVQKGYRLALGLGRSVTASLDAFDPQLVHIATPDLAGMAAVDYARRHGLPLTSTFHTNFASYLRYWGFFPRLLTPLAWRLKRRLYAPFDRVYAPTRSMGEELVKMGVVDQYAILARGVDPQRFHPRHRSENWRRQYKIAQDRPAVLFCARIVWEKGLRTLVDALRRLRIFAPAHEVVIVGDGAQLGWLKRQLSFAHFTEFLTDDDLARAYASCDIFLYPSTTDTFGNVTLEAMASGLPVVGARAPGTKCIVDHEKSGYLVRPEDPRGLAEAVTQLLRNHDTRRRFSLAARRRSETFSWSTILTNFVGELDELVARPISVQ